MSVIRQADRRRYATISQDALNDNRLSFRARGLLGYLLSKPETWRAESEQLAREAPEGRDAVRTALKELETVGYVWRRKTQGDRGRWATEVIVFESPADRLAAEAEGAHLPITDDWKSVVGATSTNTENPQVAPTTDSPTVGGPGAEVKTDQKEITHTPLAPPDGAANTDSGRAGRKKTTVPDGWAPDAALLAWAAEKFPAVELDGETESFLDHHAAKGSRFVDWGKAWRVWIRNADRFDRRRGPVLPPLPPAPVGEMPNPNVQRARAAIEELHVETRRQVPREALIDRALETLDQNPLVSSADLVLALEVWVEGNYPMAVAT